MVREIGFTINCNNSCIMCTNRMPLPKHYRERTSDEILTEISYFANSSQPPLEIAITGGEPTIRPDFFMLIDSLRRTVPSAHLRLVTNARMCSYETFARRLCATGNISAISELHSDKPKIHDTITRTSGSFSEAKKGIENLLAQGMQLELRIVVHKLNYERISHLVRYYNCCFPSCKRIVIFPIDLIGNAHKNLQTLYVPLSRMRKHIASAVRKSNIPVMLFHLPYCAVDRECWPHIQALTVPERRVDFAHGCTKCDFKHKCPRVWSTYLKKAGGSEFVPIQDGSAKS